MSDAQQSKEERRAARAKRNEERDAARAAAKAKARADRQANKAKEVQDAMFAPSLRLQRQSSIKTQSRKATFACGGSIDFKPDSKQQKAGTDTEDGIPSIDIRFGDSGKGMTLTLRAQTAESSEFQALLKACQPASFGRRNEEILDEDYRKAGKLDRTAFATNFCPHEAGIIDVVAQLLLSPSSQKDHKRSIKAELYKLNVYSAPSGKFKAHVDTPRSEDQIGSLVVCLPLDHEGGELGVRNSGKELTFDWSQRASDGDDPMVQWAAFYSDCEHEVHEVTTGHRLTLTYNLYVTRGLSHLAGSASALDPCQLPLYQPLKNALDNPGFLRRGRVLAVWLTHSYAHTNEHVNFLPSSLKGADMALYEAASALGLWCRVMPVIKGWYSHYYEDRDGSYLAASKFYGVNKCNNGSGKLDPEGGKGFGSEIPSGKMTWLNPPHKKKAKADKDAAPDEAKSQQKTTSKKDEMIDENEKFKEVQMAYMTYGNEPGIGIEYSRATMLIRIPPYLKRPEKNRPNSFWADIQDDYNEYYEDYDFDEWYDDESQAESEEDYDDWQEYDDDSYEYSTDEEVVSQAEAASDTSPADAPQA